MNTILKQLATLSLALAIATISIFHAPSAHATGNSALYFHQLKSMVVGSTYTVQVRAYSAGTNVNAVEADFTYPTSMLTYSSIDTSSSSFDINASSTGGSGSVAIGLGSTTGVNGDLLVANITFNVVAVGTADLTFQNSSVLLASSNNANTLGTLSNASFISRGAASTPVYRLSRSGNYLFTTSTAERDAAISSYGYSNEGIGFYGYTNTDTGLSPVYRVSKNGNYLFTTSTAERDAAISSYGYSNEGIGFYGYSTP
jgi:hypothetical protein